MLVDQVWEIWDGGKKDGRASEFVNLADENLKDPIQAEAWKLVPAEMRDYISEKFGDSGFMIRRDMIDAAVGHRSASVADAWTGKSGISEPARKAFTDAFTVLWGTNAFSRLVRAEKFWQAGVSIAKNSIVIKSIIVPMSNLASDVLQLASHGVGPRAIARGFTETLVEIDRRSRTTSCPRRLTVGWVIRQSRHPTKTLRCRLRALSDQCCTKHIST